MRASVRARRYTQGMRNRAPSPQPDCVPHSSAAPRREIARGPSTVEKGSAAEQRAVDLLLRKGYRIVDRNFRTKIGELDIVARMGTTLVFVEVRSRRSYRFGSALEAVDARKRRQVSRVAALYLNWRRPRFVAARFDVIALTGDDIVHVEDAWRLSR